MRVVLAVAVLETMSLAVAGLFGKTHGLMITTCLCAGAVVLATLISRGKK